MKIRFFTVKFLLLSCLVGMAIFTTLFHDELMSASTNHHESPGAGAIHAEGIKPTQSFLQIIFASH
jgi:hypothetical protein